MSKILVSIYSRPGCHLCDEAKEAIYRADCFDLFILEEINIDLDPLLQEKYVYEIPVVFINDVKAFKYSVDTKEFRQKIERLARKSRKE